MNRTILFGICVSIFTLVVAPTIPAQEFNQIENAYERVINDKLESIEEALTKEHLSPDKLVQQIVNSIISLKGYVNHQNEETQPVIVGFIIKTIISLFFSLIGTVFGMIFGPILAFVVLLITSPAVFLAKIIGFILGTEVSISE